MTHMPASHQGAIKMFLYFFIFINVFIGGCFDKGIYVCTIQVC